MSDFINYSNGSLQAAKTIKVSNNDADYKDASIDDIKKKLKLFEEKEANTATEADKSQLSAQQTTLQAQKDNLEKQMGELQEEISQKEEEAQEHSDKITRYISTTKSKSKEYSKRVESVTNDAVKQALNDYKQGNIGKAEVATRIQSYIKMSNLSTSDVDLVIDLMNTEQETVKELARQLTNITDKIGILKIKYTSVSSVYKVVSNTLNQIGKTSTSYSNSDYNTQTPIYTTDKALDITDLANKYSILATNTAKTEGGAVSQPLTYDEKISSINEKYASQLTRAKNSSTSDQSYSSNTATSVLYSLMNNSDFVSELANAGLSQSEMCKFFADNFSKAGVYYDSNKNTVTYPNGMDSDARSAFSGVTKLIQGAKTATNPFLGTLDTASSAGNTIDSNEQLKTLSENYDAILSELKNKGYTFKEAMYALFGENSANGYKGIFSDCGINYDLEKQGQDNANYSINPAGDEKTALMYKNMAAKIGELWGVQPDNLKNSGNNSSSSEVKKENVSTKRTDPISFKVGDTEYSFVVDRDNDGIFDGVNEFAGADENTNWVQDLLQYDKDGDGVLSQEELKNVYLLGAKTTVSGSDTSSSDGRNAADTNTQNVQYSSTSAYDLGIDSIDLRQFLNADGSVNTSLINKSSGFDINGNETFSDSFSFSVNGEQVTATRKDDTDDYLNTVFGDASGRSNALGGLDIDQIVSQSAQEFNLGFSEAGLEAIGVVKNASNIYQELVDYKQKTESEAKEYMEAKKQKAADKAYNDQSKGNWSSMQSKVMVAAQQLFENTIPDDFMQQAKSYYERRGANLSASELAAAVKDMYDTIDDFEEGNKTDSSRDKALDFIVEAHKKGFDNNISISEAENAIKKGMEVEDFIKSKQ